MAKHGEPKKQPKRSENDEVPKEAPKPPIKKRRRCVSQAAVEAIPKR
jgi:hypothetical protein